MMSNHDSVKLEPVKGDGVWTETDRARIQYSIAVSLKRIADNVEHLTEYVGRLANDVEQIKHGYKFICERWPPK